MYPVSQDYLERIKSTNRKFKIDIKIIHATGEINLTDKDIPIGSVTFNELSQAGDDFTFGSATISNFSFNMYNKSEYDNIELANAKVIPTVSLLVREGIDAHFVQPSQPSKYKGFEDEYEPVPLGVFNIDDYKKHMTTVQVKSLDNMVKFNKPYSLSKLSYPATLYQIYINACNVCDVIPATINFPNKDYIVQSRPSNDLMFRDIIRFVAQLSGTFAKMNRVGNLELKWYQPTSIDLGPSNRFSFKAMDYEMSIKGIKYTTQDNVYLIGTEDYAIDLTSNPLLQDNYDIVLNNIFNNIKNTKFVPYDSVWQGNPALQAGDIITQTDRQGYTYNTLVTNSTYKYMGRSTMSARGRLETQKGYKVPDERALTIIRNIEKEVGDQLTSFEQAQLQATELLTNMLGGYIVKDEENGILYIADNPDMSLAMKVWKYGIDGFGYSSNGADGPYTTAVTADGSIVAMLVSANIITANMIQVGILQSSNGKVHIDLDNNTFNLGNVLTFDGTELKLSSPDIPDEFDPSAIEKDITDIKNLASGTTLKGGVTTINNQRVRVEHGGTNQYSELRADGFFRKYPYGEGAYLNDIHIVQNLAGSAWASTPSSINVTLPTRFQGRGDSTKIILVLKDFYEHDFVDADTSGQVRFYPRRIYLTLEVVSSNFNLTNPRITITAHLHHERGYRAGNVEQVYRSVGFDLIAIGS